MSRAGGCDACLMEVDTSTGAATEVVRMDVGPTPSLGFLSDGSLYGWTENSDTFISIDVSSGETESLTGRVSSYGHHMGVTADDRIMWVNGGGQFWEIETDGEMTQLGDLSKTSSDIWDNVNAYGARGDISGDGTLWVGSEVTFGGGSPRIIVVRVTGDGPEVLTLLDAPEGTYFHAMTWTY